MDVLCWQEQRLAGLQVNVVHHHRDEDSWVTRVELVESITQLEASVEACEGCKRDRENSELRARVQQV